MTILEKDLLNTNVDKIRLDIPSLKDIVYLNSGWTGPTPKAALDAIQKSLQNQVQLGFSTKEALRAQVAELTEAKLKIASFFSTSSKNICLTTNTTLGINLALNGYNWNSNDEIITTKYDHASVIIPLYNLKERYNVKIKLIDLDPSNPVKSFKENITKNTKAAVFCHLFWMNGNLLPLKEIVLLFRENNVISIIDGAQSAGAISINLDDIGPDFYCVPGQKWLLGPVGTGFLYLNSNHFGKRPPWPSIVGYKSSEGKDGGDDSQYDLNYHWNPKKDAGVFEFSDLNNSLFCGLTKAIDFAEQNLKELNIYKRIYQLADYLIEKLKENRNISIITSNTHGGLVLWQHKKFSSHEVVKKLWEANRILIREIPNFNLCRASVHYFNTKKEIDFLCEQLQKL